jgi:hypothetical protein
MYWASLALCKLTSLDLGFFLEDLDSQIFSRINLADNLLSGVLMYLFRLKKLNINWSNDLTPNVSCFVLSSGAKHFKFFFPIL